MFVSCVSSAVLPIPAKLLLMFRAYSALSVSHSCFFSLQLRSIPARILSEMLSKITRSGLVFPHSHSVVDLKPIRT